MHFVHLFCFEYFFYRTVTFTFYVTWIALYKYSSALHVPNKIMFHQVILSRVTSSHDQHGGITIHLKVLYICKSENGAAGSLFFLCAKGKEVAEGTQGLQALEEFLEKKKASESGFWVISAD